MKIEHVAMYVIDLEKSKDFFIKYFSATSSNQYHNIKTGFKSYFLSFENGARLEIMTRPNMQDLSKSPDRTGFVHLSFSLGSKDLVNNLTNQLKIDGYEVLSGPRVTGDGYYESCIIGPENNVLELTE